MLGGDNMTEEQYLKIYEEKRSQQQDRERIQIYQI